MKRDLIFICLFILFISMLFSAMVFHFWLPYSYIVFSLLVSILAVVIIDQVKGKMQLGAFLSVVALFFFLRIVYNIASNFSFIPLADSYQDYAVTRILMENGTSSVVTSETGFIGLQYPSSWPLLHIFASSFSMITGIDALHVALAVPQVFSLVIFMFVFLFLRKVIHELGLSNKVLFLSMLIYAISSDNIYTQMQFVRQNFAQVFLTIIIFYFVAQAYTDTRARSRHKALLFFLIITLVFTHCYTPFTMLIFLISFLSVFYILKYGIPRAKLKIALNRNFSASFSTLLFITVALFVYWFSYATTIWITQRWLLQRLINPSIGIYVFQLETAVVRGSYYDILRPQPYINLLNVRDAAIYGSAAIAFLIYAGKVFVKKKLTFYRLFLLCSTMAFFVVFLSYDLFWGLQPFRVVWLSAPLIAFFAAIFYEYFLSKKKIIFRITIFSLLITTIFSGLISPCFHYYIPLYLYDPSTRFEDVGSHNPVYLNVMPFVADHLPLERYKSVVSDDPHLLYTILPTKMYKGIRDLYDLSVLYTILSPKIARELGIREIGTSGELPPSENIVLFEFIHLNPSFHSLPYLSISKEPIDILETVKILKQRIILNYNLVYDGGFDKIYVLESHD